MREAYRSQRGSLGSPRSVSIQLILDGERGSLNRIGVNVVVCLTRGEQTMEETKYVRLSEDFAGKTKTRLQKRVVLLVPRQTIVIVDILGLDPSIFSEEGTHVVGQGTESINDVRYPLAWDRKVSAMLVFGVDANRQLGNGLLGRRRALRSTFRVRTR